MTVETTQPTETVEGLRSTIASLEQQLIALYAEKQYGLWSPAEGDHSEDLQQELIELRTALRSIQEEAPSGEAEQTIAGLAEQLASLYSEREQAPDTATLQMALEGLEAQLASLYAERCEGGSGDSYEETANNLEAQVAALLEERNDLASVLERAKARIVELIAAQVDGEFSA